MRPYAWGSRVLGDYWPFAALALVGDWRRQLRPLWSPGHLDVVHPILRLGRTHLFMGLAIVVARWAGTGLALYLLILFFYFYAADEQLSENLYGSAGGPAREPVRPV